MTPSALAIASRSSVDRLDQPAYALGDALLVEQEVAAGPLEQPGVEQRDRRVDDRVAVLERGLEDALGLLDGRPDVCDQALQPVRRRPGQTREVQAGRQLEEDVDDARLGDPHGVGKRARLADDAAVVVELEPGRALERDRAGARPRADQDGHAVGQVRPGRGGQRLGAVGRTDDDHELGTGQGLGDIVPRVPDRGEALEIAGRRDPAGPVDRDHVVAVLLRRVRAPPRGRAGRSRTPTQPLRCPLPALSRA